MAKKKQFQRSKKPENKKLKYPIIEKLCPVCENYFSTKRGHKSEKTTCSRSCANTYFRSGINNPNWNKNKYRNTCFEFHDEICVVNGCGERNIIEVHHYDENKKNNSPENLIPLCPTHHRYMHSRYRELIVESVDAYRKMFLENKFKKIEYNYLPEEVEIIKDKYK